MSHGLAREVREPRRGHHLRKSLSGIVGGCATLLAMACGPTEPSPGAPPSGNASIAALHRAQCARCHALPEPRTRTREVLEAAAKRHARRVRLTDDQWRAMVDYLATPEQ